MFETPKTLLNFKMKDGELELKDLGFKDAFLFPKSVDLIKYLISIYNKKNCVVLDFFAGSGTTGQAIMDLNKEDNGNRKFILIEQSDYIETLTKERLDRSISKYLYNETFEFVKD